MDKTPKILFLGPKGEEYNRVRALLNEPSLPHAPDLMAAFVLSVAILVVCGKCSST